MTLDYLNRLYFLMWSCILVYCCYLVCGWSLVQEMEFGWRIVLGTFIGFCGAAFGSVGGIGGGGIFVSMISIIIGFDPKSSTAISKCKIVTC